MANKRGRGCKCCGCSCSDLYITGVRIAFDTEDCPTDYGPSFPAIPETCYKWVSGTYDMMLDEPLTSAVYKAENCPTKCVWKYFDPCELVDFSGPGLNAKAFPMIATFFQASKSNFWINVNFYLVIVLDTSLKYMSGPIGGPFSQLITVGMVNRRMELFTGGRECCANYCRIPMSHLEQVYLRGTGNPPHYAGVLYVDGETQEDVARKVALCGGTIGIPMGLAGLTCGAQVLQGKQVTPIPGDPFSGPFYWAYDLNRPTNVAVELLTNEDRVFCCCPDCECSDSAFCSIDLDFSNGSSNALDCDGSTTDAHLTTTAAATFGQKGIFEKDSDGICKAHWEWIGATCPTIATTTGSLWLLKFSNPNQGTVDACPISCTRIDYTIEFRLFSVNEFDLGYECSDGLKLKPKFKRTWYYQQKITATATTTNRSGGYGPCVASAPVETTCTRDWYGPVEKGANCATKRNLIKATDSGEVTQAIESCEGVYSPINVPLSRTSSPDLIFYAQDIIDACGITDFNRWKESGSDCVSFIPSSMRAPNAATCFAIAAGSATPPPVTAVSVKVNPCG